MTYDSNELEQEKISHIWRKKDHCSRTIQQNGISKKILTATK